MSNEKGKESIQDIKEESNKRLPWYPFKETSNFTYGIHRYRLIDNELITAVSAQTWPEYIDRLSRITEKDKLVVSPELMTFTGQPLSEVMKTRQVIENRVNEIKETSKKHPQTLFLLGTPTFPAKGKPRNSVLYIKDGKIVGETNKRSNATPEEREYFDLPAEEPAALIPGTKIGLLICADLSSLSIFDLRNAKEVLRFVGRDNLIGANLTFVHPEAKSLLVVSCWGVGGNRQLMKPKGANEYYLSQLRGVVTRVMRNFPQLEEILNIDRTPIMGKDLQPYTPTYPFNVLYRRKATSSV